MRQMNFKPTLLLLLLSISLGLFSQTKQISSADSLRNKVDSHISSFLSTIPLHPDSLSIASDRLIAAGEQNNLSSYIAGKLFMIFKDSGIMGLESVSAYIAQKYFISDLLTPPEGLSKSEITLFVEFNKHSLIGMDAPELVMTTPSGIHKSLKESLGSRYTILIFFDDQCTICKTELPELFKISQFSNYDGLSVFAVFTHPDTSRLRNFIAGLPAKDLRNWTFVSDPDYSTDFPRLYNVIKTPQIFLIDHSGKIRGRNLSSSSLDELLSKLYEKDKEFSEQASRFAAAYIEAIDFEDSASVKTSISTLFSNLSSASDKELYRSVFSYIFEALLYSQNEKRKEASIIVAKDFIIPYPELWIDKEYPSKWVPSMVRRTKMNRVGSLFPEHTLLNTSGKRTTLGKTSSKFTLVIFTDPHCATCKTFTEILKQEYKNLRRRGVKIISVNTMGTPSSSKEYKISDKIKWQILSPLDNDISSLFQLYETESVPYTLLLDRKGRIVAKNIDFATLKNITR